MFELSRLQQRLRQPEVMDDPGLAPHRFVDSLVGLRRINTITGSTRILWPALRSLIQDSGATPFRILDVACGGGDGAIALWKQAKREGFSVEIEGCDINAHAVEFATASAQKANAHLNFYQHDVLNDTFPREYDCIVSSLFLHHLDEDDAHRFLSNAAKNVRSGILIHDLTRSAPAYVFTYFGVRFVSRCDVVHVDGPRSVEGAFTPREAKTLAESAGLKGCKVHPKWPFRFLLEWRRPQ